MLIDVNILVYASVVGFVQHLRSRTWLNERLNGTARVGLPWAILLGFMRLTTNPRMVPNPMTLSAAWGEVKLWISCPVVWIPEPTDRHAEVFEALIPQAGGGPNLVPDLHLAALAIEHGLTLISSECDFSRFHQRRWSTP